MALLNITKNQKAIVDALLALAGFVVATLLSNADAFNGSPVRPFIPIIGAIGGYVISDFATLVDTGTAPVTPILEAQALETLKQALTIPGLTDTEKQVIQTAITVLTSKQATGTNRPA